LRKPQYVSIRAHLRQVASSPRTVFEFTFHAEREMREDEIDRLDVLNAIRRCRSAAEQPTEAGFRYVVEGPDHANRTISVVVEIDDTDPNVVVVTVWRGRQ